MGKSLVLIELNNFGKKIEDIGSGASSEDIALLSDVSEKKLGNNDTGEFYLKTPTLFNFVGGAYKTEGTLILLYKKAGGGYWYRPNSITNMDDDWEGSLASSLEKDIDKMSSIVINLQKGGNSSGNISLRKNLSYNPSSEEPYQYFFNLTLNIKNPLVLKKKKQDNFFVKDAEESTVSILGGSYPKINTFSTTCAVLKGFGIFYNSNFDLPYTIMEINNVFTVVRSPNTSGLKRLVYESSRITKEGSSTDYWYSFAIKFLEYSKIDYRLPSTEEKLQKLRVLAESKYIKWEKNQRRKKAKTIPKVKNFRSFEVLYFSYTIKFLRYYTTSLKKTQKMKLHDDVTETSSAKVKSLYADANIFMTVEDVASLDQLNTASEFYHYYKYLLLSASYNWKPREIWIEGSVLFLGTYDLTVVSGTSNTPMIITEEGSITIYSSSFQGNIKFFRKSKPVDNDTEDTEIQEEELKERLQGMSVERASFSDNYLFGHDIK